MANSPFQIKVEAQLNEAVTLDIFQRQLEDIAKKINDNGGLKINVNLSDSEFGKVIQQINDVQTKIAQTLNTGINSSASDASKIVEVYKVAEDGSKKLVKQIQDIELGQNKVKQEVYGQVKGHEELLKVQERITDNSKKRQDTNEKEIYDAIEKSLVRINELKVEALNTDGAINEELKRQLAEEISNQEALQTKKTDTNLTNVEREVALVQKKVELANEYAIAEAKAQDTAKKVQQAKEQAEAKALLQEQIQFYNQLSDHLTTINNIKIKLLTADENETRELQKQLEIEELTVNSMDKKKIPQNLYNPELETNRLKEQINLNQLLAIAEGKVTDADKKRNETLRSQIEFLRQRLEKDKQSYTSKTSGVKDETNLADLTNRYNELNQQIQGYLSSSDKLTKENVDGLRLILSELERTITGYKDLEKTVEKGFNFNQYRNVSNEYVTIKSRQDGYNTSLIKGNKLISASVQETEQYLKVTQQLQDGNWIKDVGVYINKANNEMFEFNKSVRNTLTDTITMRKALETAVTRMTQWAVAGGAVFGALRFFKDGVSYVNELNQALTQISIVQGYSQEKVGQLGKEYQNLAQSMSLTTSEVSKGAVEFYRQGLNDSEVMDRLKQTTMYAKISSLDFNDAAKIITATVNSMGISSKKAIDTFAYLGDATATGADEIGEAFSKVG